MFDLLDLILTVMPFETWFSRRVIGSILVSIAVALIYRDSVPGHPQFIPLFIIFIGCALGLIWNYRFQQKKTASRAA